jgi:aspartate aminotransferase-like enzyme
LELQRRIAKSSGIEIAVGQGRYADAINRIGHMGWVEQPELDATIEALSAAIRA